MTATTPRPEPFWTALARKSFREAEAAKAEGYRRIAAEYLRFARWCMNMEREYQ